MAKANQPKWTYWGRRGVMLVVPASAAGAFWHFAIYTTYMIRGSEWYVMAGNTGAGYRKEAALARRMGYPVCANLDEAWAAMQAMGALAPAASVEEVKEEVG